MVYNVVITADAESDLDGFLSYLLFVKKNKQAAQNFLDDFEKTKNKLSCVAESLKYCENPKLRKEGYKRINFRTHKYFMLFRIDNGVVIIDNIFHELQDYESKLL